jgi:hypothetical protein
MGDREIPAINRRVKEIRLALGLSQAKFVYGSIVVVNDRLVKLICGAFSVNETYLNSCLRCLLCFYK